MKILPVTVSATNPLQVAFPDGSIHSALGVIGTTYAVGSGLYTAFVQQGQPPIVFRVGTTASGGGALTS